MTALISRPDAIRTPANRRTRIDSASRPSETYPESQYLRRWTGHQAARYQDLLRTIAAAPAPGPVSKA